MGNGCCKGCGGGEDKDMLFTPVKGRPSPEEMEKKRKEAEKEEEEKRKRGEKEQSQKENAPSSSEGKSKTSLRKFFTCCCVMQCSCRLKNADEGADGGGEREAAKLQKKLDKELAKKKKEEEKAKEKERKEKEKLDKKNKKNDKSSGGGGTATDKGAVVLHNDISKEDEGDNENEESAIISAVPLSSIQVKDDFFGKPPDDGDTNGINQSDVEEIDMIDETVDDILNMEMDYQQQKEQDQAGDGPSANEFTPITNVEMSSGQTVDIFGENQGTGSAGVNFSTPAANVEGSGFNEAFTGGEGGLDGDGAEERNPFEITDDD
eukprot:Nk52_evm45s2391 gene=Nk52_evmTU45s2391